MDGFEWIERLPEEQQERLYDLMRGVANAQNEYVAALAPELLADARERGDAWMEVYVRNFQLRALVFNQEKAREALPQAVSLLERAHRDDAADCPQSVCVTHLLTTTYGLIDPPGYAEQRITACLETLEKTDERRVCFVCLNNEVAEVLTDQGRHEEALEVLERARARREELGVPLDPDDTGMRAALALHRLGRHDEALERIDEALESGQIYRGQSWMRNTFQIRALILVALGRAEEALEHLSPVEQVFEDGGFARQLELTEALVQAGVLPAPEAVARCAQLSAEALRRGVAHAGLGLSLLAARLDAPNGSLAVVSALAERARNHISELRQPSDWAEQFDAVVELAGSTEPEDNSFEAAVRKLEAAPQGALAANVADTWKFLGFGERAARVLEDTYASIPDDLDLFHALCQRAIEERDAERLEALTTSPPSHEDGEAFATWYRAIFAERAGELEHAIELMRELWKTSKWPGLAERLGELLIRMGEPLEALALWRETHELLAGEHDQFLWLAMSAASAAGDWEALSELAALAELPELSPDRAPNEDWGYVRLRFPQEQLCLAKRIGPTTARVLSIRAPGEPQRHGEVVVFRPVVLNGEEMAEDEEALRIYDAWVSLHPSEHFCVTLDGIHPGEEALDAMLEEIAQADVFFQRAASDEYTVTDPDSGEEHKGLYFFLAVSEQSAPVLLQIIRAHQGEQMWVYPELLERTGDTSDAAEHRERARRWEL